MNITRSSNQRFTPGKNHPTRQSAQKRWSLKILLALGILVTLTGCNQSGYGGGYSGYNRGYYGRGGYSSGGFNIGGVTHGQQFGIQHSIGSGGFGHGGGGHGGGGHGGGGRH